MRLIGRDWACGDVSLGGFGEGVGRGGGPMAFLSSIVGGRVVILEGDGGRLVGLGRYCRFQRGDEMGIVERKGYGWTVELEGWRGY